MVFRVTGILLKGRKGPILDSPQVTCKTKVVEDDEVSRIIFEGKENFYCHTGCEGIYGARWSEPSTRWSTTLSSKVNLPHAINFRTKRGANLVT